MLENQGYTYQMQLGPSAGGRTLIEFLSQEFKHSSAQEWTDRIAHGEILLGGQKPSPEQILQSGMHLVWNRPAWRENDTPRTYETIFEDQHLLIVNKPSGLPTLPGGGFYENTLLRLVQQHAPTARPMHRLGRGTSGLVLFAKTRAAASAIGKAWPTIQKQYKALGSGKAKQAEYAIKTPIGKVSHPRLGEIHAATTSGKFSHSAARAVDHFALNENQDATLFEVDLLTGRPHQIRIHLASIGHPLVGDPIYASGGGLKTRPGLPGDLGYHLHAERLTFAHPVSGLHLAVACSPPAALQQPPTPTGHQRKLSG